jgi:diguanylate cyclase (GGDEF)-like protein
MIDIDHFKKVNDEHGHQAGDTVLREAARVMQETLRSVDSLGRYGGEEFVAILPQTTHQDGMQTAERLREVVEKHVFRAGSKQLRITVSVGVACHPREDVDSPGALISQADKALYRAKQAGRNRVA